MSDEKVGFICIALFAITVALSITYYEAQDLNVTKEALKNGYSQRQTVTGRLIWVKDSNLTEKEE